MLEESLTWQPATKMVNAWRQVPRLGPSHSWEPLSGMVATWKNLIDMQTKEWGGLLTHSDELLFPLCDPFHFDYATHRWFCGTHENHYSDWLAWILTAINNITLVGELFDSNIFKDFTLSSYSVERETIVDDGHEEKKGRLDIRIVVDQKAVLIVEIKLCSAEAADLQKQEGYHRSLAKQFDGMEWGKVLLATEGKHTEYAGGFVLKKWKHICIRLRNISKTILQKDNSSAMLSAAILHFVGAVEQNLLRMKRPVGSIIDKQTLEYMKKLLGGKSND